jgi:SHO1 osmosensor
VASAISSAWKTDPYPNYCWLSVAFMLLLIFGIFAAIVSDTTEVYRVAIVGFLAASLILTTSSVNNLLYTSDVARQTAAAGFVVLSILDVKKALLDVIQAYANGR